MKKQILTIVSLVILSTQVLAQAKDKAFDYTLGSKHIVCDKDGESDQVILEMVAEYDKDKFQESLSLAGVKLSQQLNDILTKKEVSAVTPEIEIADMLKKAACLTKQISAGDMHASFSARFKKTLAGVEAQLKKNNAEMPSYDDAKDESEQNSAIANEIIHTNRGVFSFALTLFN